MKLFQSVLRLAFGPLFVWVRSQTLRHVSESPVQIVQMDAVSEVLTLAVENPGKVGALRIDGDVTLYVAVNRYDENSRWWWMVSFAKTGWTPFCLSRADRTSLYWAAKILDGFGVPECTVTRTVKAGSVREFQFMRPMADHEARRIPSTAA